MDEHGADHDVGDPRVGHEALGAHELRDDLAGNLAVDLSQLLEVCVQHDDVCADRHGAAGRRASDRAGTEDQYRGWSDARYAAE